MDRFMDFVTRKVKVPLMIDSTDARCIELALRKCQGKAIVNSINLEDGEERFEKVVPLLRTYGGGGGGGLHRRGQAAGHGGHPRSASSPSPSARYELLTGKYGLARARPDLRPARLPGGHRRRELRRLRGRDHRGHPRDQGALPRVQDHPRHLERVVRPARRRPRGAERGLPLPLHQGGPRLRDRQQRAARALRLDPRGGAPARRGPDLHARRGPGGRLRRALPRPARRRREDAGVALPLDERLARYIVEGSQGRPDRRPRPQARGGERRSTSSTGRS